MGANYVVPSVENTPFSKQAPMMLNDPCFNPNKNSKPQVAIYVGSFNRQDRLHELLDSVNAQTFRILNY